MTNLPTAPAAGSPVSATLIRRILDTIRARTILRGPGYRVRETPNGVVLDIDRPKPPDKPMPGLWTIVYPSESGQDGGHFDYPYYMVGTRLYRASDDDIEFSFGQDGIACLVVRLDGAQPSATVEFFDTFEEVQERAKGADVSVRPLYEFKGGYAVRDFRNMPVFGTWEFEQ